VLMRLYYFHIVADCASNVSDLLLAQGELRSHSERAPIRLSREGLREAAHSASDRRAVKGRLHMHSCRIFEFDLLQGRSFRQPRRLQHVSVEFKA
jgi:hypothetical protein